MPKNSVLSPWIFILDDNGRIIDRVKVSWPKVRMIYRDAKQLSTQSP